MRWEDVNLVDRVWIVPNTVAKAKQAIAVPLSAQAIEILTQRKTEHSDPAIPWVFPTHAACGHLVEVKTAWKRILERAGVENLTVHDLRRTMASWQARCGAPLNIIGRSLGHRDLNATKIYARLQVEDVRESVDAAAAAMQGTVEAAQVKTLTQTLQVPGATTGQDH